MKEIKLIGPFRQLLTLGNLSLKGALQDEALEIIENAGILIQNDKILDFGDFAELKSSVTHEEIEEIFLEQDYIALPSWVDCHTHICFGGSRAKDFSKRNAGKSYLEIAQEGGGIWDTVTETRKLSQDRLAQITSKNAHRHLQDGVTTIEVKSGYGLNVAEEIKMLRAIKQADRQTVADLIPTCLAAHMLPKDYSGTSQAYLELLVEELFPMLKKEKLANRVDSFVEKSAFSPVEITSYYRKAIEYGFDLTVHADQFSTGGSELAVRLGARSADHLEASGAAEIKALAQSDTIAVALPGASLGLGIAFAPARKILDASGALAIGSDWNPGSAPMGDLLTQASILATFEKLSTAEVFAALTFRAAAALGIFDRGKIQKGFQADFNVFQTSDYREILYHQGRLKPAQVWKKGHIAYSLSSEI